MFDRAANKISEFLIVYRLYIRMRIRNVVVEEQIQWVLLYVQEGLIDIEKKNVIENLENRNLSYATMREFLSDLEEEFGRDNNEIIKIAKLKIVEQENKTTEEFV